MFTTQLRSREYSISAVVFASIGRRSFFSPSMIRQDLQNKEYMQIFTIVGHYYAAAVGAFELLDWHSAQTCCQVAHNDPSVIS